MRLKSDSSGVDQLYDYIERFYLDRNRQISYLSSGTVGRGVDEGDHYFVSFILDRKHVVKYSMPMAIRTFAVLWYGVGPEYIPMQYLVKSEFLDKISGDNSTEAIDANLALLDLYLEGKLS